MAITSPQSQSGVLTYEHYLAEDEIHQRYDIVDGVRIYRPAPKWRHQRIQVNSTDILRDYEKRQGGGYVIPAPFDVLIRRIPLLQTRQPDVLYVTQAQLDTGSGISESGPLEVAPELVIEIISDSETERRLADKLADYASIGVREGWLVRSDTRTVEVVRLSPDDPATISTYDETQTLQSITFADLRVCVADFFRR
jgi:Uma2 family endonuclease